MPYIVPNNILAPEEKVIKPYNCTFIAVDGPKIKGKIDLEGLEIPYDMQFTSQMTLSPSDTNIPINYGFLGKDVTFLMIRAMFNPKDSNFTIETDNYLEYYFEDDPTIRYMGQLLVLTGNSVHKVSQIYLSNPNENYEVNLEVFVANINQINSSVITDGSNLFSGLYYNNIISNKVVVGGTPKSSSNLYVTDNDGNILLVIPYENIKVISVHENENTLIIGNDTPDKIVLKYLTKDEMYQSYSRINWVLEDPDNRILTKMSPTKDYDPPVYNWTPSGATDDYITFPSGTTFNKSELIDFFIAAIYDDRDGYMDKYIT
jgi:hypothetical protein